MTPRFFATSARFRAWLEKHHATRRELFVGFYKKRTGKPSVTWPDAVDEALCFGWIDSVRRRLDDEAYVVRFTPRRSGSRWSDRNLARVAELTALGRMAPAGLLAFETRVIAPSDADASSRPADATLTRDQYRALRANRRAVVFFDAQPPWYRRTASRWVASAAREATRQRRLDQLITASAEGRIIAPLRRVGATTGGRGSRGTRPRRQ